MSIWSMHKAFPRVAANRPSRLGRSFRFQCPECGFGDHEVAHLIAETGLLRRVCLEEEGRLISIRCGGA